METSRDKKIIETYWNKRADSYEKLEWATKSSYLFTFLNAGQFNIRDSVLDIGTGTGIITHALSSSIKKAVGVDICPRMLKHSMDTRSDNETFLKAEAARLPFTSQTFSKVTARMVFHHVIENTQKAMDECFRVLKKGGIMVFSEGVPPSTRVRPFYTEMFKLKEERLTFMEKDLVSLMKNSGFKITQKIIHWNRRSSLKNWLSNSGIEHSKQKKIYQMHLDLDDSGKNDYNMVHHNGDCFIDMKFAIIIGKK